MIVISLINPTLWSENAVFRRHDFKVSESPKTLFKQGKQKYFGYISE